ncbi:hypothetical protein PXH80_27400, partial [Mycolicibacterium smegmatis]|uniref:hypothetical protein n=1 Tax=Mycolicibacterium smegmatis TaxID=1772 RepID=UPI0023DBE442
HLRSAFPSGWLNPREVQLSLAGQALSLIYTPSPEIIREKSGLDRVIDIPPLGSSQHLIYVFGFESIKRRDGS